MPLGYVSKQVEEIESISVDFGNRLGSNEAIASVQVKAFEDSIDVSTSIIVGAPGLAGTVVTVRVKNGTDGKRYDLQFLVTATSGNTYEEDVILVVREETA